MKVAVRYYTKSGNTERLAKAVAKACKVEFLGIHKGRPNESDMEAAAIFAKEIIGE